MLRKTVIPLVLLCLIPGCSTYEYAKNVKLVAFENNVSEGRSVGPVRGDICQVFIMGNGIGEGATMDRALAQAREKNHLRYINNVTTEQYGFETGFYGRHCISARGTGYE